MVLSIMKPKNIFYVQTALLTLFLSGCSLFSPVNVDMQSYLITSQPSSTSFKHTKPGVLVVSSMDVLPVYDTLQMAYTKSPYQVSYFAKNQWAETPAKMLQSLMIQSLQNSHAFKTVVSSRFSGNYDYVLNTQLIELIQDFTRQPSIVHLTVRAQLVNSHSGNVIRSKTFKIDERASGSPYGGVIATNHAAHRFLEQLIRFCNH